MTTTFYWGWKNYPRQEDPLMTRERMLRLMKAWRRASTQGRKEFALVKFGVHAYQVIHIPTGEVATMHWEKC